MSNSAYRLSQADGYPGDATEQRRHQRRARGEVASLRKCAGCRNTLLPQYHEPKCLVCLMREERQNG